MRLLPKDADTLQLVGERDIGTGTPVPMALAFHRDNAAWVAAAIRSFVAGGGVAPTLDDHADRLVARVAGTDFESFLTILNHRPGAGSVVLTEDQARGLIQAFSAL